MERTDIRSLLFFLQILVILARFAISSADQSDVDCLRSIKESLEDPRRSFSSWDFSNNTEGFICRFTGIECWNSSESKVLNIKLPYMGLSGPFPIGIRNCTSLVGLDLSSNHLKGNIPSNVGNLLPFVTHLDLSNNNLSGQIPPSIVNLTFLNTLKLDNNQLTGQIPPDLSKIVRLKVFNVANNRLSGQVPLLKSDSISVESYANNLGLCGGPLSPCIDENFFDDLFFLGFVVGFPVFTTLTISLTLCCLPGLSTINVRYYLILIKSFIKGRKHHLIPPISHQLKFTRNTTEERKIAAMEQYVRRLDLVELKLATNDFDTKNVIGYGKMGLVYKAIFPDGLMLAIKRLHKFESFEKEFLLEIEILGRLRHINLVPLLCFCFETGKKFLAYKYMSNGTLHQWLHSTRQVEGRNMAWSLRLRIAVGITRGLAWLHHNNALRVAHLSISSNCILLDDKFEPKISDFGNSKILMNTRGTISSGHTSEMPSSSHDLYKEDVYSFGILLLEIVSGKEWPIAEANFLGDNVCGDQEFNMIDECLMRQGFDEEIYEALRIAENCVRTHKDGAASMLEVYQAICAIGRSGNEISVDLCLDLEGEEGDL